MQTKQKPVSSTAESLIDLAQTLARTVNKLCFAPPVTHTYNPLDYAWAAHAEYLRRYGNSEKRIVFLGMNPGPFGMVQCGVPFGEITVVRDWLGIQNKIEKPNKENPKRPIEGFSCTRSEVSGRRLWGLFQQRFSKADAFFKQHFVLNYCPLAFFAEGRNLTPDKLPASESAALYHACDEHLRGVLQTLKAEWLIGVGAFAETRAKIAIADSPSKRPIRIGRILHPSPASPAANRGWAEAASQQLMALGVWA
ncbi:MAG: uracil-DNA glycosylase family protein [Pseudomonadota bacterium]